MKKTFTYKKSTGQLLMYSEGSNSYNNPNWEDIELDVSDEEIEKIKSHKPFIKDKKLVLEPIETKENDKQVTIGDLKKLGLIK